MYNTNVSQKSQMSLKRRVSEQAAEITHLKQITASEMSSTSEATPECSFSFPVPHGPFHARRSPIYSPVPREPKREDAPIKFVSYL